MAMPEGLSFNDRIAYDKKSKTYWFQCQRGHRKRASRPTRSDIEDVRADHDRDYHRGDSIAAENRRVTLADALGAVVGHTEQLVELATRSRKTLKEVRDGQKMLVRFFGGQRTVASLNIDSIRKYIVWRATTTSTGGAATVKELKLVQRVARERGLFLGWRIRDLIDEINPKRRPKIYIPPAMVIDFVTAHGREGLFFDVTFTKLRTALRNKELANIRIGDINLTSEPIHAADGGIIPPRAIRYIKLCKAKRSHEWSFVPVPADLTAVLLRRMGDRPRTDLLFTTANGGQLNDDTLYRASVRAWKKVAEKWGFPPGNLGFAQLRGQVTTSVIKTNGIESASKLAGHHSTTMTEKYYDYDREAIDPKRLGSDSAAAVYSLDLAGGTAETTPAGQAA